MSSERDHPIEEIFRRFDDMAIGDIKAAFAGGARVGAFILTFVAIDCLSSWYAGARSGKNGFKKFVEDFFPDPYKRFAEDFYLNLRCGLVHNYSTKTSKYALKDGCPSAHLTTTHGGTTVINWEDFFENFLAAKEKYYEKVRQSKELQDNLQKRIERPGLLQVRQISLPPLFDATTEVSTISESVSSEVTTIGKPRG